MNSRNLIWFVAWRYVWAKKSMNTIHLLMWGSILSAVVGIGSLFLILSIYNGIEKNTYKQLAIVCPDLKVTSKSGKAKMDFTMEEERRLSQLEGVAFYGKVLCQEVLMEARDKKIVVNLIGVDTAFHHITNLESYTINPQWSLGTADLPLLTISYIAANQLLIDPDQMEGNLLLTTVRSNAASANLTSELSKDFAMPYTTYYDVGSAVGNLPLVYTNIHFVRNLMHEDDAVCSYLIIKVKKGFDVEKVKENIQRIFPHWVASNRYEQNKTYYNVIQSEKRMLILVVLFMLLIALTGSLGTMRVLFVEKINHAKVLYCLGLPYHLVMRQFFVQGLIVNSLGLCIGLSLGILIGLSQKVFGWIKVSSSLYSISYDIDMSVQDIVMIVVGVSILNVLVVCFGMRGIGNRIKQDGLRRF